MRASILGVVMNYRARAQQSGARTRNRPERIAVPVGQESDSITSTITRTSTNERGRISGMRY